MTMKQTGYTQADSVTEMEEFESSPNFYYEDATGYSGCYAEPFADHDD